MAAGDGIKQRFLLLPEITGSRHLRRQGQNVLFHKGRDGSVALSGGDAGFAVSFVIESDSNVLHALTVSRNQGFASFKQDDLARLIGPAFVLHPLTGLVVLDEIQRRPDLFPLLRVLADRPNSPARFLLLGSAAPDLLRHTAETLVHCADAD